MRLHQTLVSEVKDGEGGEGQALFGSSLDGQPGGLLLHFDKVPYSSLSLVDYAQVMVGICVFLVLLNGSLISVLRPFKVTSIIVDISQLVIDLVFLSLVPEGIEQQINSFLKPLLLPMNTCSFKRLSYLLLLLIFGQLSVIPHGLYRFA